MLSRITRMISPRLPGTGWPVDSQYWQMRSGILPEWRNFGSSGSITARNGRLSEARLVSISYDRFSSPRCQARRHSCTSHNPTTFFESRQVLKTPPSLVKLYERVVGDKPGFLTSVPIMDHVPELIQAKSSTSAGTATTAEPVSWQAGAMTGIEIFPVSGAIFRNRLPRMVPGWVTGPNKWVGMPSASSTGKAQSRLFGSKHCVVVASVNSLVICPHSQ